MQQCMKLATMISGHIEEEAAMLSSKSSKSKVGFIKWNAITASEGRFYVSGSVTRACVFRHARMRDVRDATPPASKEAGQVAETGGGRQRYESYLSRLSPYGA